MRFCSLFNQSLIAPEFEPEQDRDGVDDGVHVRAYGVALAVEIEVDAMPVIFYEGADDDPGKADNDENVVEWPEKVFIGNILADLHSYC